MELLVKEIEERYEEFYNLISTIDKSPLLSEKYVDDDRKLSDILRIDLAMYSLFLSASDGAIQQSECVFISKFLKWDIDIELANFIVTKQDLSSSVFCDLVPKSLSIFVELEKEFPSETHFAVGDYISLFDIIGRALITIDHNTQECEVNAFNQYLDMLMIYVESEFPNINIPQFNPNSLEYFK